MARRFEVGALPRRDADNPVARANPYGSSSYRASPNSSSPYHASQGRSTPHGPTPRNTSHYPSYDYQQNYNYGPSEPGTPSYPGTPDVQSRTESYTTLVEDRNVSRPPLAASRGNGWRIPSGISSETTTLASNSRQYLPSARESETTLLGFNSGSPTKGKEGLDFPDLTSTTTIFQRDWMRDGTVIKSHERDDFDHMANWKRYLFYLAPFLAALTLITYWVYFGLRISCVLSAQRKSKQTFPMAWVFIGIELSVAFPSFMYLFWTMFMIKPRRRPRYRLTGDDVPPVDVLITCCSEDVDLILDTVRAACEVDYPTDRFRVVLLDDGSSDQLRTQVAYLQGQYTNLYYRSRAKLANVPHHFKAGNLNYGLRLVKDLPGGAAQFIAALDADMIPERDWLRAIMPHLLLDRKMGLACPPQLFYNVPKGDPLCQSLDFFVHVSEPVKDALGVAWCTGSGYIMRRDAIEEIGCFPQGSLAEDVATSTMMLGKGWRTAFVHEPLQFGTVPESFSSHLKQRTRWAIGTIDTSVKLRFCLWGENIRQMTFYQRLCGFIYAVLSVFNIFLVISLFTLPVVLISGRPLVAYADDSQLRLLIRASFATLVANRLFEIVIFLPSGYNTGQRGGRAHLWMSFYLALTIIRSFLLPKWLGGEVQNFQATGSLRSALNERDAVLRAPLLHRMRVIIFNYLAGYHVIFAYFCLTAVTLSTSNCLTNYAAPEDRLRCLITHAFWPPVTWITVISAFWIPIHYAINPPTMPPREDLLDRDPKTLVAHPTADAKKTALSAQTVMFELEYCLSTAFTVAVFVAAFFWI